jgi:hypothetical protein
MLKAEPRGGLPGCFSADRVRLGASTNSWYKISASPGSSSPIPSFASPGQAQDATVDGGTYVRRALSLRIPRCYRTHGPLEDVST